MLAKTNGIVIRNVRYGEGSVISKIYTRNFGMQSYMINGIYNAKSSLKASLLQPLMVLDLVVYYNKLKEVQRIKEAKCPYQFVSLHFDNTKAGICLFVSELLNKTIVEEEPNALLYDFIENSILSLDQEKGKLTNWPIYFMIRLSKWLGFPPENNFNKTDQIYFDLSAGVFTAFPEKNDLALGPPESEYFSRLISVKTEELNTIQIPKISRQEILQKLIQYYRLHLSDFKDIKSIEVLSEIN